MGRTSTKIDFLLKNVVLGLFWSFLELLDLKIGSRSKFYTGKWYREVWRTKISPFRDKSVKLQFLNDTCAWTPNKVFMRLGKSRQV
jgi:hypothetical protein